MRRRNLTGLVVLAGLFVVVSSCLAERDVKVYEVKPGGDLALKEAAVKTHITDTEALIDDFEDDEPRNYLEGENGTWNLTPDNEEVSIANETVEKAGVNGSRALKITYDVESGEVAKGGYWTKLREFNARGYDHLSFDVRGDEEAGFTDIILIEMKKYKNDARIDKIKGTFLVNSITSEWTNVIIPLNMFTGLFDQTNAKVWEDPMTAREKLDELVINLESRRASKKTGVLYFDNFKFIKTGNPGQHIIDQPKRSIEKTPTKIEGVEFAKFLVKRLGGYPTETTPKKEFPADDKEFLMMLARDTWKFFDHIVDQEHGLPLDTIQLGETTPIAKDGWVGDYTNVTNIGLYLMCLVSAYDFGFITEEEAIKRIKLTMDTIEKLEHHESGFLYNYYDTTTLEKTSYFVSLVDSGWLDAGMYVAKNAFPVLKEQAERILASHSFEFFYDEVEQQMTHGYFAHLKVRSDYHYGSFYTEPRAASYIAIGRGEVPVEHWFRLVRTFPDEYSWQQQMPINRELRTTLGYTYPGGYYEWKGKKYLPSWGGSMFEAIMPTLILDEVKLAPEGLGLNDKRHVEIQIQYTLEDLKYPVWGMSPSSDPEVTYSEFGVQPLGSKGYKAGVVTPHAAVLGLEFAPEATVKNLRELAKQFPALYGEYGYYDAVTVKNGKIARKYLALDQSMIFVTLNNYLNDGAIRKRFHADPINENVLPLLTEEKFFESNQASRA